MLLKLLNTASTWLICQEAMVENHSRRCYKTPLCNWIRFVDCWAWQVLILVEVSTEGKSC